MLPPTKYGLCKCWIFSLLLILSGLIGFILAQPHPWLIIREILSILLSPPIIVLVLLLITIYAIKEIL